MWKLLTLSVSKYAEQACSSSRDRYSGLKTLTSRGQVDGDGVDHDLVRNATLVPLKGPRQKQH